MTVDEQPYYSPTAVAFCLEQPCALPSEDNYRQRKQQESNPLLRMTPGYEVADTCNLLFEAALDRAFRDLDNGDGATTCARRCPALPNIASKPAFLKKKRCARH